MAAKLKLKYDQKYEVSLNVSQGLQITPVMLMIQAKKFTDSRINHEYCVLVHEKSSRILEQQIQLSEQDVKMEDTLIVIPFHKLLGAAQQLLNEK